MAGKMKKTKKSRTPKTSKGINGGARSTSLNSVQKVLMGKGLAHVTPPRKKK